MNFWSDPFSALFFRVWLSCPLFEFGGELPSCFPVRAWTPWPSTGVGIWFGGLGRQRRGEEGWPLKWWLVGCTARLALSARDWCSGACPSPLVLQLARADAPASSSRPNRRVAREATTATAANGIHAVQGRAMGVGGRCRASPVSPLKKRWAHASG